MLIDIAVPRDIEPSVRDCPGITLYDMDDLQRAVARNLGAREAEADARRARSCDEEVERFERWLASLDVVPTIAALRERGDEVVEQVLRENEARWESLSEADRERLEVMARAVVSRLLHEPTLRLKDAGEAPTTTCRRCASCSGSTPAPADGRAPAAEVTRLDARRRPRRDAGSGTRGSALALAQARLVAEPARRRGRARHDHDLRATAAPRGDKSRFVKEIEEALLAGEIDLAVHSAKDVPGELPDGLAIVGVPERADARDALCGARSLDELAEGAVVGTASLRRRAAAAGRCAPTSSARAARQRRHAAAAARRRATSTRSCWRCAGLERLGRGDEGAPLDASSCPPPGQGCLALEARADDARLRPAAARSPTPPRCARADRGARAGRRRSTRPATRRSAPTRAWTAARCG